MHYNACKLTAANISLMASHIRTHRQQWMGGCQYYSQITAPIRLNPDDPLEGLL